MLLLIFPLYEIIKTWNNFINWIQTGFIYDYQNNDHENNNEQQRPNQLQPN